MIQFEYAGKNLPYPNEWHEIKRKYLEELGPFREELEKSGITFLFNFPLESHELPVNFSGGPIDLASRMSHYAETGEYIPPSHPKE